MVRSYHNVLKDRHPFEHLDELERPSEAMFYDLMPMKSAYVHPVKQYFTLANSVNSGH
jgi:hypothetical protein